MRYLVLDIGGQPGVRAGVNITIEPTKYSRVTAKPFTGRADFGRLISGQESELAEITFEAMVSGEEHKKLTALHNLASQQIDKGLIPEIVLYDFWEEFSELGAQTRAHVPGTTPFSSADFSSYFVVRAGYFQMRTITYSNCPVVECTFTESFKVLYETLYP